MLLFLLFSLSGNVFMTVVRSAFFPEAQTRYRVHFYTLAKTIPFYDAPRKTYCPFFFRPTDVNRQRSFSLRLVSLFPPPFACQIRIAPKRRACEEPPSFLRRRGTSLFVGGVFSLSPLFFEVLNSVGLRIDVGPPLFREWQG